MLSFDFFFLFAKNFIYMVHLILKIRETLHGHASRSGDDVEMIPHLDTAADIDVAAAEPGDPESPTATQTEGEGSSPSGVLALLGLHAMPLMAWLALLAAVFASAGILVQSMVHSVFGDYLPATFAVLCAGPPAVLLTSRLSRLVGRIIPRETSSAISERSYGRSRRGVVTVGVAKAGSPAQVRFTDLHGNMHYLMAEPFDPADEIGEGSEVVILRTRSGDLRIVQVS
jgi:hypothetical protein